MSYLVFEYNQHIRKSNKLCIVIENGKWCGGFFPVKYIVCRWILSFPWPENGL